MASEKNSRRRFLSRTLKVLLGGLAFQSTVGKTSSGDRSHPRVSWREAMHYAVKRRFAG